MIETLIARGEVQPSRQFDELTRHRLRALWRNSHDAHAGLRDALADARYLMARADLTNQEREELRHLAGILQGMLLALVDGWCPLVGLSQQANQDQM